MAAHTVTSPTVGRSVTGLRSHVMAEASVPSSQYSLDERTTSTKSVSGMPAMRQGVKHACK